MNLRCAAMVLVATLAHGALAQEGESAFDGTWEGTLDVVARYGSFERRWLPDDRTPLRLELRRGRVRRVALGDWRPRLKSGFRLDQYDAAAVIYAAHTSPDVIETWQMSVTKTGEDSALVFFWRVVNYKLLAAEEGSRLAYGFMGYLTRSR